MAMLPEFLRKYFWDVDFDKLIMRRHRSYVLRRILDHGDQEAVAWMRRNFDGSEIRQCVTSARDLSRKSANYWALVLDVPRERLRCLNRRSLQEPKTIWPY